MSVINSNRENPPSTNLSTMGSTPSLSGPVSCLHLIPFKRVTYTFYITRGYFHYLKKPLMLSIPLIHNGSWGYGEPLWGHLWPLDATDITSVLEPRPKLHSRECPYSMCL